MFHKSQKLPDDILDLIELRDKVRNSDYLTNDQIAFANNNLTFMIQQTVKRFEDELR
jgi:hypothetical protein